MKDNHIQICPGNLNHIEDCLEIAAGLPDYFNRSGLVQLKKDLQAHNLHVIKINEETAAFITVIHKNSSVTEITWLAVKKEFQNQGLGGMLLKEITGNLEQEGRKLITTKTLSAGVDYPPYEITRRFYKKNKFIEIDEIDPYPGWEAGNPCLLLARIL
ncbi:MAG: GNAT family N-acetyltransferase [Vulcanimicrobiota bacterium]